MSLELPQSEIQLEIPVSWSCVANIREMVEMAVSMRAPGLSAASVVVASELVENAIKYGEAVPAAAQARFHFTMTGSKVMIAVKSGARSGPHLELLMQRIAYIAASPNKEELCLERMQELISQPEQHGQLGLYRIVYEAGFDLSCTYEDEVLLVRATRDIP